MYLKLCTPQRGDAIGIKYLEQKIAQPDYLVFEIQNNRKIVGLIILNKYIPPFLLSNGFCIKDSEECDPGLDESRQNEVRGMTMNNYFKLEKEFKKNTKIEEELNDLTTKHTFSTFPVLEFTVVCGKGLGRLLLGFICNIAEGLNMEYITCEPSTTDTERIYKTKYNFQGPIKTLLRDRLFWKTAEKEWEEYKEQNAKRLLFIKTADLKSRLGEKLTGGLVVYLGKSDQPDKKYVVVVGSRHIHFGARGMYDFTLKQHQLTDKRVAHDVNRKALYLRRHKHRENWGKSGIATRGFWSRWLLWNKPTKAESVRDIEQRFHITILPLTHK